MGLQKWLRRFVAHLSDVRRNEEKRSRSKESEKILGRMKTTLQVTRTTGRVRMLHNRKRGNGALISRRLKLRKAGSWDWSYTSLARIRCSARNSAVLPASLATPCIHVSPICRHVPHPMTVDHASGTRSSDQFDSQQEQFISID